MTRGRLREELIWGVATLLATPLCLALLPVALPFLFAERLGGARRRAADSAEHPRAR